MAAKKLSRLSKALLETAEGMHRIGVMDDATYEKITMREAIDAADASLANGKGRIVTEEHMRQLADDVKARGRERFRAAFRKGFVHFVGYIAIKQGESCETVLAQKQLIIDYAQSSGRRLRGFIIEDQNTCQITSNIPWIGPHSWPELIEMCAGQQPWPDSISRHVGIVVAELNRLPANVLIVSNLLAKAALVALDRIGSDKFQIHIEVIFAERNGGWGRMPGME